VDEANLKNGVMLGGPTCTYKDKEIPCYVGCSPNASITSQMLADMLSVLDQSEVFDRKNGSKPFLLLYGHHSRFGLPFLEYIHHNNHRWTCCIGVPYGTHIWQVADSPHMNGSFKSELTKAKRELLSFESKETSKFLQTNVIPLVRKAWSASFAKKEKSITAISQRGWNPLNYKLLDHPNIIFSTKSSEASSQMIPDCDKLVEINKDGKRFNNYLDDLILDEARKEGRKNKLDNTHQEAARRERDLSLLTIYHNCTILVYFSSNCSEML
jgi:hypothetical protein